MNLVIDDAVEVKQATKADKEEKRRALGKEIRANTALLCPRADIYLGQILLKGDNVSLIQALQ